MQLYKPDFVREGKAGRQSVLSRLKQNKHFTKIVTYFVLVVSTSRYNNASLTKHWRMWASVPLPLAC